MAHPPNYLMSNYALIYDQVEKTIQEADRAFINLEFVVDPDRPLSGYPHFNVHHDYVEAAIDAGFDVFALANNHTADFHTAGIEATADSLETIATDNAIWYSGIGRPGNWESVAVQTGSTRVGFVSISMISNEWAGRDAFYFVGTEAVRTEFLSWVAKEQEEFDVYVVSVHGGDEYVLEPNPEKKAFLEAISNTGVEIVWAHHPHVLQPFAYVRQERGQLGAIIYSAGNFVSGQTWRLTPSDYGIRRAYTGDSALYQVELARVRGEYGVANVEATLISHYIDHGGVVVRYLEELAMLPRNHRWAEFYRKRLDAVRRFSEESWLIGFGDVPEEAALFTRE
jgi:poly-gamma-glutamate synthesis protein (capsule biosynthesis protein)